jgi:drug/metabolite transporter (DMT)-like permease
MKLEKLGDWIILGFGVAAISWGGPLIRLTSAPALTVAAWRMALAALILLPLGVRGWRRKEAVLAGLAGAFLAAHLAFWIQALRLTSVASAVVLVNTTPLFVGLISWLLGERIERAFWSGVFLALFGTVLIGLGDFSLSRTALLGDLLALLGALGFAGYLLLGRRAQRGMSLFPYVSLTYAGAALILAFLAWTKKTLLPPRSDWPWLVLIALVSQVLGHTTVNRALRRFPAWAVAVVVLGEPAGAALWAYLLFREALRPLQGLGMLLVFLGILWGLRSLRR